MTSELRERTIGDLCEAGVVELQTGPFGSQLHAYDYQAVGVPVVPTEGIKDRRVDHTVLPKVSPTKAQQLQRHTLRTGDILFARRGVQATGRVALVSEAEDGFLCGTGAIRLRVDGSYDVIDPTYLSYVLADPVSVRWFKFHAIGATMPNLNESIIRSFRFSIPPLAEQRAIADILGTLDDKIELNRRMSETLEGIARALFKSWFVDFDPVRAKAEGRETGLPKEIEELFPDRLVKSEIGEVPEGWEPTPLTDLLDVNPSYKLRKGAVAPYVDMASMPTSSHVPERVMSRPFGSGMRFSNGDTLVARITPCLENGKTAYVDFLPENQVGWGSTEYIVLRPKPPLPNEWGYCLARSHRFREFAIQSMTGSSGRQRVPSSSLVHFRMPVGRETQLVSTFGSVVRPIFARAALAAAESRSLAAIRNELLPKLISGTLPLGSFGLES